MKHWNFEPLATSTGPQALEMITHMWRADAPLDLAIIDHRMPEMSGDDLLHHIHMLPGNKSLPVIMLTSIDMPDAAKRFAHLGLSACLAKPPRSSHLYDAIVSTISQHRDRKDKAS
ncbi:MAG: response regulator [Pseudomonadota bacterium]